MKPQNRNKRARDQNIFSQNASHLMCFCNFSTGYFLTLKTQFVRHVIEFMFKDQISPDHLTSNTNKSDDFTSKPNFANLTVRSMVIPITNRLPYFFRTDANFYQMALSYTLCRGPNESLMKKKANVIRVKALRKD